MTDEAAKRALFDPRGIEAVSNNDAYTRRDAPKGQLALAGPSRGLAAGHMPVRGDLAHIRLAGICFVPHYAVPMPHRAGPQGAVLRASASPDSDEILRLDAGAAFDVLEIAGGWCWGEVRVDGPVGYIALAALEATGP